MNLQTIQALIAAATPFLRVEGTKPVTWCRNVQSGPRFGPWQYEAVFSELDVKTWQRAGEVIYFVTDSQQQLRLVGESSHRLKDRWRMSPMHEVKTRAPLGRKALFHSTAWGAIERGVAAEAPPFTVSALFRDDVADLLTRHGAMDHLPASDEHLCRRTESAILAAVGATGRLWNKRGVSNASI
ncbi:MAG: hypothetical protein ABI589_12495 [Burkholderiales bacterium]